MNFKAELEALLFASDQPLSVARLVEVLPRADKAKVQEALEALEEEYQDDARALRVVRVAGGYQLATKQEYANVVRRLFVGKRRVRLTKPALEALAIIAYKQPTTRPEIDAIRGVSSGGVLETLLERNLVRIAGRAEGVGRPLLYATTTDFLQYLGLNHLRDLPNLEELEAMLAEREEAMRREEDEELRAMAEAREAATADVDGPEGGDGTTLEDKLRSRDLPTLDELDEELDVKRSAIEQVAARVEAERHPEATGDAPAAPHAAHDVAHEPASEAEPPYEAATPRDANAETAELEAQSTASEAPRTGD